MTAIDPTIPIRPQVSRLALGRLLPAAATADLTGPDLAVEVAGVALDSRAVRPGDLYVALPGHAHHGAEFAAAAVRGGAVAVLTDRAGAARVGDLGCPVVVDDDPRRTLAQAAATVYGRPADRLTTFGITGTNGKTTTAYLLAAALRAAGHHPGIVGTIGFFVDGQPLPGARSTVTTPEAPDLQALLAVMAERGADSVALEVSSHALVLGRVDAICFDAVAFTTFGGDHLDFHGTVAAYWAAKASLFTAGRARRAVINIDDPRGPELLAQARAEGLVVATVSLQDPAADYRGQLRPRGGDGTMTVDARWPGGQTTFALGLPGRFNVRNALTALALVDLAGLDLVAASSGLADAGVPGRMQRVPLAGPAPTAYVDFAHTPPAVTAALRAVNDRHTVAVLGCGGDRDPHKRGPMGAAAAQEADVVVVTDDNPRTEDPARIRAAVLAGARSAASRRATELTEVGDRRAAIRQALTAAGPDDVVAVLGKGHEQGQETGGQVLAFDDAVVIGEEWRRIVASAAGRPREGS